ncbi:MAG: RecQ family ATP-dependent DNA helicase [Myxococcales bacterium]|nr:RecQ family ATP-dependent DNA helicase [Myxococcales bacterium]
MDLATAASGSGDRLTAALERHFGFARFRPGQRQIVESVLSDRPVVAVMPTGAGKSLCYQLPALLLDGVTVVVSPLIALMKDQVEALRARGIPSAFVNSTLDQATQRRILDDAAAGHLKLLYLAPERFKFGGALASLKRIPISLFAVDEAHCISAWGHDFRPDYMALGRVAQELGVPRVAAFTATATPRVRDDIIRNLGLEDPIVTVAGFLRENLRLSVLPIQQMKEKPRYAQKVLSTCGGPAVVYCATRKNCEKAAKALTRLGFNVVVYHGGLDDDSRSAAQDAFQQRDDVIIVATNAFGMGVDKPNVRAVVHWDLPGSLDAYYQEAGRAGRDGAPAFCAMLFTYADTRIQEFFIDNSGEGLSAERRAVIAESGRQKLRAVVRYAYEEGCRHAAILRYFGDSVRGCEAHGDGGPADVICDNCRNAESLPSGFKVAVGTPASARDGATGVVAGAPMAEPRPLDEEEEVIVQKALSAVARARGRLSHREVARVLKGSKSRETLQDALAETKSYGMLSGLQEKVIVALLRALERAGCTRGRNPVLTNLGNEAMWRRASVQLAMPPFAERPAKAKASRGAATAPPLDLPPEQEELLRKLKQRRIEVARERGVPAFHIASNKLLERLLGLAEPDRRDAWLAIDGVGPNNVDPLREVFAELLGA